MTGQCYKLQHRPRPIVLPFSFGFSCRPNPELDIVYPQVGLANSNFNLIPQPHSSLRPKYHTLGTIID